MTKATQTSADTHRFEPYDDEPAYCWRCDKHEGDKSHAPASESSSDKRE